MEIFNGKDELQMLKTKKGFGLLKMGREHSGSKKIEQVHLGSANNGIR